MKKQLDIKKLVLLNLPYLLMGLFATNLGEGWRMATGADASAKMLSFFSTLPVALASWWPSLHPLDLLVGVCCGAGLRLAVYLKSKNAKKYRHGMEYGSARWGTHEDITPYIDPVPQNNVILTKTARNKNVLVIGGSGSGKTRFWLKPNLMQMHSSYVVTDPKGTILVECGKMLQRGAPKLDKDGKPVKDKRGKVIYEPYRIKVLNTINFKKSMHYNPFAYIHSEKDILKLVTTLIANTKGEGKAGDDFWVKAETLLYCALIGYIHYEAPVEEQNFSTLIEMINSMEVREDDEEYKNAVDMILHVRISKEAALSALTNSFFDEIRSRVDRYALSTDFNSISKYFGEKNGVVISTLHGVKGEEYTSVIAAGLLNGYLPHWDYILSPMKKSCRKNETYKLLYVLCSRARKNLYLFSESGRTTRNGSPYTSTDELSLIADLL